MDGREGQQMDRNPRSGETSAKKKQWSLEEDDTLIQLHLSGTTWEDISKRLSGRTASACIGRYYIHLKQRIWNGKNLHKLVRPHETALGGQHGLEYEIGELAPPSQASVEAVLDFRASREDRAAEVENLEQETARPSHATRYLDRHPSAMDGRVEPSPSPYETHASDSHSQNAPSRLPISPPQSYHGQTPLAYLQPGLHSPDAYPVAPRDPHATQATNALNQSAFRQQPISRQPRPLLSIPPRSAAPNTIPEAEGNQAAATTPSQSSAASHPEGIRNQPSPDDPSAPWLCTKCGRRFSYHASAKKHYRRRHTQEGIFKCLALGCYEQFVRADSLEDHMRRKHPA